MSAAPLDETARCGSLRAPGPTLTREDQRELDRLAARLERRLKG